MTTSVDINSYPKIKQPKKLKANLMPHQLTSIYFMERVEKRSILPPSKKLGTTHTSRIGILADEPGFGKTLSIVGLVLRDKLPWDLDDPYVFDTLVHSGFKGLYQIHERKETPKVAETLVICNASIMHQWEAEFAKSPLTTTTLLNKKRCDELVFGAQDVVICNITMLNYLNILHKDITWKRFVFDEPDSKNIPKIDFVQAGFYWFVTATPEKFNYMRKFGGNMVKNLLAQIPPEVMNAIKVQNSKEYMEASKATLDNNLQVTTKVHKVSIPTHLTNVQDVISGEAAVQLANGNIKEAIELLGGTTSSNVFELITEKKNREVKEAKLKIREFRNDPTKSQSLTYWKDKLKEINGQIALLKERYESSLKEECPICKDDIHKPVLTPCCQHIYCGSCVMAWLTAQKGECPMCRANLSLDSVIYIASKDEITTKPKKKKKTKSSQPMSKPEHIKRIIQRKIHGNTVTGKFLIFSDHKEGFIQVTRFLSDTHIRAEVLKGHPSTREKLIDEYKTGDLHILLLNAQYNASGINLENTTDVILFHELLPEVERQVVGRALRIGRTEPLTIHKFSG